MPIGLNIRIRPAMCMLPAPVAPAAFPMKARSQLLVHAEDSSGTVVSTLQAPADLTYQRPTKGIELRNYICEAYGPYPIVGAASAAGINQLNNAPYAGSFTAVYAWYPNRYGAKDAFRIGNYNLLAYVGGNVALEFFYIGPHSLLSRMRLNNTHGSPGPGPNHGPDRGPNNGTNQ